MATADLEDDINRVSIDLGAEDAEEQIYSVVAREWESGSTKPGLLTKAEIEADGDSAKARALYLRWRVEQVRAEIVGTRFRKLSENPAFARVRRTVSRYQKLWVIAGLMLSASAFAYSAWPSLSGKTEPAVEPILLGAPGRAQYHGLIDEFMLARDSLWENHAWEMLTAMKASITGHPQYVSDIQLLSAVYKQFEQELLQQTAFTVLPQTASNAMEYRIPATTDPVQVLSWTQSEWAQIRGQVRQARSVALGLFDLVPTPQLKSPESSYFDRYTSERFAGRLGKLRVELDVASSNVMATLKVSPNPHDLISDCLNDTAPYYCVMEPVFEGREYLLSDGLSQ